MRPKSQLVLKDAALSRPSGIHEFLGELKKSDSVSGYHHIPSREPVLVDFPADLHPAVQRVLETRGISKLYSHQRHSFELARSGNNVVVVTPTASGKTLCYNLPVIQRIVENPDSRALYLYPTKALTYDQLDDLMQWANVLGPAGGSGEIGVYSYDGDTPQDARAAVRSRGHIVLSNPDMLHKGILPHHTRWNRLFENLQFVVLDELHTYRGVFRKPRRQCVSAVGSDLRILWKQNRNSSARLATIANPQELAEKLTGQPFEFIRESGAGESGSMLSSTIRQSTVSWHTPIVRYGSTTHIAAAFKAEMFPRSFSPTAG